MSVILYTYQKCPFCRPILMLSKYLDLNLKIKEYDLSKAEHLSPEFLKINPQHTLPTIQDGDFTIWESTVILQYLADKYIPATDDSLFPKDLKKRAKVQFRVQFVLGTLLGRGTAAYVPLIKGMSTTVNPEKVANVHEALGWMENFLKEDKYAAGDHVTIADFALASAISTLDYFGLNWQKYNNISKWYAATQQLKGFQGPMTDGFEQKSPFSLE